MTPNPYAAPAATTGATGIHYGAGAARLVGDVLVVRKDAALPAVCLKCGARDGVVYRPTNFQWTPVWARLMVVFCTLPGAIAMLVTTKKAALAVPLCPSCNARWSAAKNATVAGVVAILLGVFGFQLVDDRSLLGLALLVTITAFVVAMVGFVRPRMLQVQKIDAQELELKGFHPGAAADIASR